MTVTAPAHIAAFGRCLVAYQGARAYIARLYMQEGALSPHRGVTQWALSPEHDLRAPCVLLVPCIDGALAYDADGTAYILGPDRAVVEDTLVWCPAFARAV